MVICELNLCLRRWHAGGQEVQEVPRADEDGGRVLRGGGRAAGGHGVHQDGGADDLQALPERQGRGGGAGPGRARGAGREGRGRRDAGDDQGGDAQAAGAGPVPEAAQGVPVRHAREPPLAPAARLAGARRLRPLGVAVRALPPPVRGHPLLVLLERININIPLVVFPRHLNLED